MDKQYKIESWIWITAYIIEILLMLYYLITGGYFFALVAMVVIIFIDNQLKEVRNSYRYKRVKERLDTIYAKLNDKY